MKLYHGSKNIIEKPVYGYGKKYNDYGVGFYCTEDIGMAKEWAVDIDSDGYANCYELDVTGLSILNLCDRNIRYYTGLLFYYKIEHFIHLLR